MPAELLARTATPADAARITEIYNQGIQDRIATFETHERTVSTVRSWFGTQYPIVVVERHGTVVAWANASLYRPRACYAGICEFSVYVDRESRGDGAGRLAMEELIRQTRSAGYTKLLSRVFVDNSASRNLLARLGFREVGIYHRHGQLDGVWRDVVIVELLLDHPASWSSVHDGQTILIEKASYAGLTASTLYPAKVIPALHHPEWIAVEAMWTLPTVEVGGVVFETGGRLEEFFRANERFNVFHVSRADGRFSGIYANIIAPIRWSRDENDSPLLIWEDHWLDIVKLPDGTVNVLDADEYLAAGIADSDPVLDAAIRVALDELLLQLRRGDWDV